tara:strand:+ start:201 stop:1136 length:936 start_codon:yes stop_codon:yes gene_type:complete
MKWLKKYLVIASVVAISPVFGDAGVSISYRSTPVIVQKNWLNDSAWPAETAYYEGITTQRSLNMVSVSLFFDDSLRGHDDKTPGMYVTKYFVREFEPPSDNHPVGRMVEREVDIGDAVSVDEINTRNGWKQGDDRVPKVYQKNVYVKSKIKGWLPGWSNPNRGAGYIFGLNFNYAAEDELVEYYSADIYIGKRLFILPHFAHLYFKIGPSVAKYNYDFVDRSMSTETRIGVFYNVGIQTQVLKGIKFFAEAEFRGYSPTSVGDTFNLENNQVDFVNVLPPSSKNYKDTKFTKGWFRGLVTQGIRFGMKFSF